MENPVNKIIHKDRNLSGEAIQKIDEKYSKITNSIDTRLKKIEEKGDLDTDEHINEIEDLVLLMQLEVTKIKEKIGGVEFGFMPSGELHSRVEELEEKVQPKAETKEDVSDIEIEGEEKIEEIKPNIDEIKKTIEDHKESFSNEMAGLIEQFNSRIDEMHYKVVSFDKAMIDINKKIGESETRSSIELHNSIDEINRKMSDIKVPDLKSLENEISKKIEAYGALESTKSIDAINRKIEELRSHVLSVSNENKDIIYKVENRIKQAESKNTEEKVGKIENFIEREFSELDKRLSKLEDHIYNTEEPNKSYTVLSDIKTILKR